MYLCYCDVLQYMYRHFSTFFVSSFVNALNLNNLYIDVVYVYRDNGVKAIENLMLKRGKFDYVLLETTGLADPGNIELFEIFK